MSTTRNTTIFLLLLIVVSIGVLHAVTPTEKLALHDFYRRVSYFPIVVAAIFYGVRGGLFLAVCTSLAFIPHLRHFYHLGPNVYFSELPEIILYLGAGIVVGSITNREKQLRIKYQDLSGQLERSYKKLHKQTCTLVEAEEQLHASQKLSALGQLSASLAHEVKNPLASIRGAVEILADDFPRDHPKHEFAEILLKETDRLSSTVEEVLRFSRNQRPIPENPKLEALPQVIERVVRLLDNNIRHKNIVLKMKLSKETDHVLIAGDKMAQVFMNLLLNSCDMLKAHGIIEVESRLNAGQVEIVFSDNGPGVAEADREKIFTPFYSTRKEGTGLGLAISSRIVASYGGTITVKSPEHGSGAVFTVFLPMAYEGVP
ncbi:MAG: sensor histidine kinase [Proteobacteria bacterium]|nr:sensor histidine kinase [Pseudomonadota bacterium]MBU1057208.1 sensor histidine kinase [Pseudomonadota bacterium]